MVYRRRVRLETWEQCESAMRGMFKEKLKIDDNIIFDGTQETNFLIVVRFTFFNDKETVLRAKRNLKSTNIFIAERLQKWVRDIRKRLFSLFKAAKEENKKCRMVYDHYRQVKIRFYYSHGQPNISKPGNHPWYADCVSHPRCQQKYHMPQGKLCTSDSF